MSRKAVVRVLIVYFVIWMAVGAIRLLATPGMADWRPAAIVGSVIGWAAALMLPGILPLIFWAFGGFRAEKAAGPLFAWAALAVLLCLFSSYEDIYEGTIQFAEIPSNVSGLFSSDQASFIREMKASCIQKQNPEAAFTAQQFDKFCQCSAEAMLREMTIGQFTTVMSSRSSIVPSWLHEIAVKVAPACQHLALGR